MRKTLLSIVLFFFSIQIVLAENATTAARALQTKATNLYWMTILVFIIVMIYVILHIMYLVLEHMRKMKMRGEGDLV